MKTMTLDTCNPGQLAIAVVLLSLSVAVTAAAQTTGLIDGAVVDANGTPLPGVVVTVTGPGVRQENVTGTDGAYTAAGLAAGDYVVTAALPGFETVETPVSVQASATASVPITLQIARLLETVSVVAEEPRIFARNIVADPMRLQQSNITSVTSVADNLPGVSIQEGDAYGFDDWSSNVAVRGFQVTISEAQIGTTIDGFPNGTDTGPLFGGETRAWPGVPYLNQFYRPGWQTRRTNTFAYLKADWAFSDVTSLSAGFYVHRNRGRGDWLPPYIVDITDDGGGPESERWAGPRYRAAHSSG